MTSPAAAMRLCVRCGAPTPSTRYRYCSDECRSAVASETEAARIAARRKPCMRCGEPKESGKRRFCDSCRAIVGDATYRQAQEQVRTERRRTAKVAAAAADPAARKRVMPYVEGQCWCTLGQHYVPVINVTKISSRHSGNCITCLADYNVNWNLVRKFGLTIDEYNALYVAQDGRCGICKGKPRKNRLSVDHCHRTGEIRGLLCSRCNHRLLGAANDSVERLRSAITYLEEGSTLAVLGERRFIEPGPSSRTSSRPVGLQARRSP